MADTAAQRSATHAGANARVPAFGASLKSDAPAAAGYFTSIDKSLAGLGMPAERNPRQRDEAQAIKLQARAAREDFFRRHAAEMYSDITGGLSKHLRLTEVAYGLADKFPGVLPTRADINSERALKLQIAKEGREIDQGLFAAHVLANPDCGLHLIHSMMRPTRRAEQMLADFRRSGHADFGLAQVDRRDNVGTVTLKNLKFLNAEDDAATAALEVATDLLLLDDQVEVCVLRGNVVEHPKYAGRRVFNAGINLTHLYYGQISLIEFFIERELGLTNKFFRGIWTSPSYREQLEDYQEKPWLAAVEAFAIGGGCQFLCVMDRVIAEPDAYFTLPASKEGFIPGCANLRFPRLVGIQAARQAIYFEKPFPAASPEGRMICDEIVPPAEMDAAIARNAEQMIRAGLVSAAANRKGLRLGQEPVDLFRQYMAVYSRQQALCCYDPRLIENLAMSWQPQQRRM
jgi:(3,5-dihydroxyphenyl)acetyl-CoA 1,2-dioxygenase